MSKENWSKAARAWARRRKHFLRPLSASYVFGFHAKLRPEEVTIESSRIAGAIRDLEDFLRSPDAKAAKLLCKHSHGLIGLTSISDSYWSWLAAPERYDYPPKDACGYVFNANGLERTKCFKSTSRLMPGPATAEEVVKVMSQSKEFVPEDLIGSIRKGFDHIARAVPSRVYRSV